MGRWAKNHDQRKGQWLYNALRPQEGRFVSPDYDKKHIADRLWNMTNEEFEKILEEYYA